MDDGLIKFLISCAAAIYFMLPAYIANLSGLAFGGKTPVDMKNNFIDGRRIIGNGVTWKGFINGTIIGTFIGALQGGLGINLNQITNGIIPFTIYGSILQGIIVGFLLAFGALMGDAIGSFLKRRIGLKSGDPAPILDQLDFVAGALLLTSFIIPLSLNFIIIIAIISIIFHILANSIAYLLGIKDVWY